MRPLALASAAAIAVLLALGACASPDTAPAAGDAAAAVPAGALVARLAVTGMTCPSRCPREVREQLEDAPGVLLVDVDYAEKLVTVTLAPGSDATVLPRFVRPPYVARLLDVH